MLAWKQNSSGSGAVTATNMFGPAGLLSRRASSGSLLYAFDAHRNVSECLTSSGTVPTAQAFDAYGSRQSTDGNTDPYCGFGGQSGYYTDWEAGTANAALELHTFRLASMDEALPAALHHFSSQADQPVIGQAGCDQQPAQPRRIAQMAVAQVKASALLVRKEGLDAEALVMPQAGFVQEGVNSRNGINRTLRLFPQVFLTGFQGLGVEPVFSSPFERGVKQYVPVMGRTGEA